ncbi:MAG: HEAT repeat domain-containing protein [Peptococcaceae bacterium]|jgi:HEAT repeat protein|nr:HEAT repeat domain-containing protein [Peptococcaceae bacterium]
MPNRPVWDQIKNVLPDMDSAEAEIFIESLRDELIPDIDWLLARAEDRDELKTVLECLGYLAPPQGMPLLFRHLNDWDEKVQLCAAGALKHYPPEDLLEPLVHMFLSQKAPAARIGDVLAPLGREAGSALMKAYPKSAPDLKIQILSFLIQILDPRCEALAYLALEDPEPEVKKTGLKAVEVMRFRSLWGNVARLLKHEFWILRGRAIQVLTDMRVTEARHLVRPLTLDPDPWVRECAGLYLCALFPDSENTWDTKEDAANDS